MSRSNKIVSLRRLASLESNVDAIAKTALVLETSTDDKKLIKLGALITIDDIPEEMMKNHAIVECRVLISVLEITYFSHYISSPCVVQRR